jgi:hypothetical protein
MNFPQAPPKPLVTALLQQPITFASAVIYVDSYSPSSRPSPSPLVFQIVDVAISGVVLGYHWIYYIYIHTRHRAALVSRSPAVQKRSESKDFENTYAGTAFGEGPQRNLGSDDSNGGSSL